MREPLWRRDYIDIPMLPPDEGSKLGGWRNGYPKEGGMTPVPLEPVIPPPMPRPDPGETKEPKSDLRELADMPMLRPRDVEDDIPSDIEERLKDDLTTPIEAVERGRYARSLPPPIRDGMKPTDIPP